jgi:hypothetical protein
MRHSFDLFVALKNFVIRNWAESYDSYFQSVAQVKR